MALDPYVKTVSIILGTLGVVGLLLLVWLAGRATGIRSVAESATTSGERTTTTVVFPRCRDAGNLYLCRDRDTGCEYVGYPGGGLTPRLRPNGTPWCDGALSPEGDR